MTIPSVVVAAATATVSLMSRRIILDILVRDLTWGLGFGWLSGPSALFLLHLLRIQLRVIVRTMTLFSYSLELLVASGVGPLGDGGFTGDGGRFGGTV